MTANKLERILNLLAELLNAEDRPRSADELRKRVGMYPLDKAAFRRTFDRDKNALRDMGVPLRVISVPVCGLRRVDSLKLGTTALKQNRTVSYCTISKRRTL